MRLRRGIANFDRHLAAGRIELLLRPEHGVPR
jgi:hypothetical protein